jgi:hypothetical protein
MGTVKKQYFENSILRFIGETVWIKGVHNTVADAISRLDYGPVRTLIKTG